MLMTINLDIKVTPNSGKQKFTLDKSGKLKCFLKSPPEKGKANNELIKLIQKKLKLNKEDIQIMLGKTSRKKRIKINTSMPYNEILKQLGIELQLTITT